jgi:hypothetical protein
VLKTRKYAQLHHAMRAMPGKLCLTNRFLASSSSPKSSVLAAVEPTVLDMLAETIYQRFTVAELAFLSFFLSFFLPLLQIESLSLLEVENFVEVLLEMLNCGDGKFRIRLESENL